MVPPVRHRRKRPGKYVDSRTVVCNFKFDANNKATKFIVGPLEWSLYCYFDKGKPNNVKKTKKPSTSQGVNEMIDYLYVKLSCTSSLKHNYCTAARGSVRMHQHYSKRTSSNHDHYKQKFEKDFVPTSKTKIFYNVCPKHIIERDYTTDGVFRISVYLTIMRIDRELAPEHNFKRMGQHIKISHSDVKFIIEHKDKTYTYEVHQQYVSMYSEVLKEKIEEFKKSNPNCFEPTINISALCEPHEMREFLSIIYPSELEIQGKNLRESFLLAKKFGSPALKNICQDYLLANYRAFTNFQLIDYANTFNLPQIAAAVLKQLDTSQGAKTILAKLQRDDGVVNAPLKSAIERHIYHNERFRRYIKPEQVERMEVDKTTHDVAKMDLEKARKKRTEKQLNQLDDRRKKLEAVRKLQPKKPNEAGPSSSADASHSQN